MDEKYFCQHLFRWTKAGAWEAAHVAGEKFDILSGTRGDCWVSYLWFLRSWGASSTPLLLLLPPRFPFQWVLFGLTNANSIQPPSLPFSPTLFPLRSENVWQCWQRPRSLNFPRFQAKVFQTGDGRATLQLSVRILKICFKTIT